MSKVDPRIPATLEVAEFKYRTDDDGDVIVLLGGFDEDRSQTVIINSRTYEYDNEEFRDVFSPAHTGELPPAKVLAYCLKENNDIKMGSWRLQVSTKTEKVALLFGAQISANASPQRLKQVLLNIAKTTDDLEKKLSSQDKF
jgi:hypothetical protein